MAEFNKGELVNVFTGDGHTAKVTWKRYMVASCGAKQLHLIRDDGSNAKFRVYAPFRGEMRYHDVQLCSVNPWEHAEVLRRQFAGWIRAHYADRTAVAEKMLQEGAIGAVGFAKAIAEGKQRFEEATADLT